MMGASSRRYEPRIQTGFFLKKPNLLTTALGCLSIQKGSSYDLTRLFLLASLDNGLIILSTVSFLVKRQQDIKEF